MPKTKIKTKEYFRIHKTKLRHSSRKTRPRKIKQKKIKKKKK